MCQLKMSKNGGKGRYRHGDGVRKHTLKEEHKKEEHRQIGFIIETVFVTTSRGYPATI